MIRSRVNLILIASILLATTACSSSFDQATIEPVAATSQHTPTKENASPTPLPSPTVPPTRTPLPSPTAVPTPLPLTPNYSFAKTTNLIHPELGHCYPDIDAIIQFSSQFTPPEGHLQSLLPSLSSDFYGEGDDALINLWSHFAVQTGETPIHADGDPIPYGVFPNTIYHVCLDRLSNEKTPLGITVLAAEQIDLDIIKAHCEKNYSVPGFIPHQAPDLVTISEPTTVSQFLQSNEPSICYGFHKDEEIAPYFNGDGQAWWNSYRFGTEQQFVTTHFWSQGAQPLPPKFDARGQAVTVQNNFPFDAVIQPGTYEFYLEGGPSGGGSAISSCSDGPPSFIPPVANPNSCYHYFGVHPVDGTWHPAQDFYTPAPSPGLAIGDGIVIDLHQNNRGEEVMSINFGCFSIDGRAVEIVGYYGHMAPLSSLSIGDKVIKGQQVATATSTTNELHFEILFTKPGAALPNSSWRADATQVDPFNVLSGYTCDPSRPHQ